METQFLIKRRNLKRRTGAWRQRIFQLICCRRFVFVLAIAAISFAVQGARAAETVPGATPPGLDPLSIPRLLVGDPAPPLSVSVWVKDGPIALQRGRIYVLDFWATWCAPCMASMPHLSKLARAYRKKGVTFIAVTASDENNSLERVRRVVRDKGEAMDFPVAFDLERQTTTSYCDGSRSSGIPNDFIIDREGRIAWMGHPNHLEKPLQAVLAGTWDPAPERAKHLKAVEAYDLEKRLLRDYNTAKQEQRWEDAVKLADQLQPLGSHLQFVLGDTFEFLLLKIKKL